MRISHGERYLGVKRGVNVCYLIKEKLSEKRAFMKNRNEKEVNGIWKIMDSEFAGKYEFPVIHGTRSIPKDMTLFSDINNDPDPGDKALCFYQYDEKIPSFFDSEKKLSSKLNVFRKYQSVILPDYSVYRDMPLSYQIFQI